MGCRENDQGNHFGRASGSNLRKKPRKSIKICPTCKTEMCGYNHGKKCYECQDKERKLPRMFVQGNHMESRVMFQHNRGLEKSAEEY